MGGVGGAPYLPALLFSDGAACLSPLPLALFASHGWMAALIITVKFCDSKT